jgi:hypothetical protein
MNRRMNLFACPVMPRSLMLEIAVFALLILAGPSS